MRAARFWRWYRALPITAMAVVCILTFGMDVLPNRVVRDLFYPVRYASQIEAASEYFGVDEYLICAVIKCESNWNEEATSSAGAVGLMQLMPTTSQTIANMGLVDASAYDPADLTNPTTNIVYGTAYLAYLQDNLDSQDEVIAAYNAGLGSVESWLSGGGDISREIRYGETASYLERVNEAYGRYRELYPEGVTATS